MDYLYKCYTAVAKWGPGESDTFTMRWYKAAPGAREYPYEHAFGSTVDATTFGCDTPPVGEIAQVSHPVSPRLPWLYDGTEEPVFNAALLYGADPAVMGVACVDGKVIITGSATSGFAPSFAAGGQACECETSTNAAGLV